MRVSFALLAMVCLLAPLPFGSNDPTSIALWCLLLAAGLAAAPTAALGPARAAMLGGLAVLLLAYGALLAMQMTPGLPMADPVWARASSLLGRPLEATPSLVAHAPLFAAGRLAGCLSAVALGLLVGAEAARARRLFALLAWSGAAYAAYAIVAAILEPTLILWLPRPGYVGDAIGTFVNRNTAAAFFGCAATLWLVWFGEAVDAALPPGPLTLARLRREAVAHLPRAVLVRFGGGLVCTAALLMSASRAGIAISLSAMGACALVMAWSRLPPRLRRLRWIALAALAAALVLQVGAGALDQRFDQSGLADADRLPVYRATLAMIADHPLLGTGAGTFSAAFPAYRGMPPSMFGVWAMAHSTPLEAAAEFGLPFAALLAVAIAIAFAILLRGVRQRRRDRILPLAGAATLGIAVAHSCIDFPLQIPGFSLVVMATLGIALAQSISSRPPPRGARTAV